MSNPNTLNAYNPQFWSRMAQELHKPRAIYRQIANFRAEEVLKTGDTFKRIRPNSGFISPYDLNTDIPVQPAIGTNEQLVVDKRYSFRYQIDDLEEIQSAVQLRDTYGKNAAKDLTNAMDSELLSNVVDATSLIDAGTVGGTAGTPLDLSGSNVIDAFSNVHKKLAEQNIDLDNLFGAIDPATMQTILANTSARETAFGDTLTREGVRGDIYEGAMINYFGLQLYVTNNYTRQVVLGLATNPTNGDTLTITIGTQAVPVQFVSSIGTTPGNVLIGANVDATRANLASLINNPTTTSATQVGWVPSSSVTADRIISRLAVSSTASNNDTLNTLTLYVKGQEVSTASSLTATSDGWSAAEASKLLMLGRKQAVDMVVQKQPTMIVRPEPRNMAVNIMSVSLFGTKLYTDGAEQLVQMRVKA